MKKMIKFIWRVIKFVGIKKNGNWLIVYFQYWMDDGWFEFEVFRGTKKGAVNRAREIKENEESIFNHCSYEVIDLDKIFGKIAKQKEKLIKEKLS